MNVDKLEKIIQKVNDGNWSEYSPFFNDDIGLFMKLVKKNGLLGLIDPLNYGMRDEQNKILYELLQLDKNKWTHFICEKVINNDIVIKNDGYYLYLKNIEDLSDLFYGGRREGVQEIAKHVLSEDGFEYFDTDSSYFEMDRDVLDELTKENLYKFSHKLFVYLDGKTIDSDIDELSDYADEQGNIIVNKENWQKIFSDTKSLSYIIENYIPDLKTKIYWLYNDCYNNSYYSEVHDLVWDELNIYFEGKPIFESRPHVSIPDKKIHYVLLKIKDVYSVIMDFLSENKDYGYQNTLEYNGSFMYVLNEMMSDGIYQRLDFSIPDYPDHGYIANCLNENINDINLND